VSTPRLLVVVAHPDDETFGCGSVLAHASARGAEIVVACATRGELGEPAPGSGVDRTSLGDVREAELRAAARELGVSRVAMLGWRDSGVDGEAAPESLVAADVDGVAAAVVGVIDDFRPDIVVTPDASDGHRDHAAIRDATLRAVERARARPARTYLWCLPRSLLAAYSGNPNLGTPDEEITTVIDTSEHLDRRWRAMRMHASQVPPYEAMSPELQLAFLASDHLVRIHPAWEGGPLERELVPG
jgi:N-acetyl-1-D-myo-inositol-2-amino-2-deoxy-alpha-D-glucopyranoside deacetylase